MGFVKIFVYFGSKTMKKIPSRGSPFIIHIISHIPKNLDLDNSIETSAVVRKINRKALLILNDNKEKINRLIMEITP